GGIPIVAEVPGGSRKSVMSYRARQLVFVDGDVKSLLQLGYRAHRVNQETVAVNLLDRDTVCGEKIHHVIDLALGGREALGKFIHRQKLLIVAGVRILLARD